MAYDPQIENSNMTPGQPVVATMGAIVCAWLLAVAASGVSAESTVPPVNPEASSIRATTKVVRRDAGSGTYLVVRNGYDRTATAITAQCRVRVFGRLKGTTKWMLLRNLNDVSDVNLTADITNDYDDGSALRYTSVRKADHYWDTMGCDEFIVLQSQSQTMTGGSVNNNTIEAKFV